MRTCMHEPHSICTSHIHRVVTIKNRNPFAVG
jgi:hypothetical protein